MTGRICEFSELAERDLTDIALYIAAGSPARALTFVTKLRKHCKTLAEHPARCRLREQYGAGVRVAVHGRYLVFYAKRGDIVVIERILHSARHLDWVRL